MIIVNKSNFTAGTIQKSRGSLTAPKSTFYSDFRICLALEGQAVWEIEDKTHRIEKGDIVLLGMGQRRRFISFGEEGLKLCVFTLNRNAFSALHHFMFFVWCIKNEQNVIKGGSLSGLLKDIYEEWEKWGRYRCEMASVRLTEFFIRLERLMGYSFNHIGKEKLEMLELMNYIDENITNGINLSWAAKKAGMSESTFSRRFLDMNGILFKQYTTEKKIQHAITLLENTNKKMIDIALESGFDSVSGFYDAFKRNTGTTPSKFCESEIQKAE